MFQLNILGKTIYGISGSEGLNLFYNEENILRGPGAGSNLLTAAWKLNDEYAIPPLDGKKWSQRKWHFMDTLTTRADAEGYLKALDSSFVATLSQLGTDGKPFSMWDTINVMVLQGLSTQLFGYSLADTERGALACATDALDNFSIFSKQIPPYDRQLKAFNLNLDYLRAVLKKHREDPAKYKDTALTKYLATAGGFADEEILLDMHQALHVGSYGIVTQAAMMVKTLADNPSIRQRIKQEAAAVLGKGAPTFNSQKQLPYTVAALKEVLRYWPAVFAVVGVPTKDLQHEGKLIPKGSKVLALLHATAHDPTIFTNPDRFDLERFLTRNEGSGDGWGGLEWDLPIFGYGSSRSNHPCAGKAVAVTFMLDLLIRLCQNWSWEFVDPNQKIIIHAVAEPSPAGGLQMRRV